MAVIRCPTHDIPYNEENPRGCPACWQQRLGSDPANVMRELARASRAIPHVEILAPPTEEEVPTQRLSGVWPPPVTQPPRLPTPEPTRLERLGAFIRAHLAAVAMGAIVLVAAALIYVITRPTFGPAMIPPPLAGDARPFPVVPHTSILGVFTLLGPRTPQVHPDDGRLARYDFGDGAVVDVFNGEVYAVTLTSGARAWEGLRVGTPDLQARGRLALLGPVREDEPVPVAPFPFGGYLAFRGMADLPRRMLTAEVRPPNGCHDVQVEIAPQVIGTATRGEDTYLAVGRRGGAMSWVVHRVRVVSRAVRGPYAGTPACE